MCLWYKCHMTSSLSKKTATYSLENMVHASPTHQINEMPYDFLFIFLFVSDLLMYFVQMKERSVQTLGYLPVGDGDFPHQKKLLQGLMDSVEVRKLTYFYK